MTQCKACDEPLVIRLDGEELEDGTDASDTVPDDLKMPCGCHFHWQCLLDESATVALSLRCPSCDAHLPSNEAGPSTTNQFLHTTPGAAILVQYTNEGGVQQNLDILPSITEEAYLQNNPEARPARALQIMCSEGDVGGIVELLTDASDQAANLEALVLYQDPLAEMKTGLHLAIEHGQEEVVWLLLWLCSALSTDTFPVPARQTAEAMSVPRLSVAPSQDIRGLNDGQGRTAHNYAEQSPGSWSTFLDHGLFSPGVTHVSLQ